MWGILQRSHGDYVCVCVCACVCVCVCACVCMCVCVCVCVCMCVCNHTHSTPPHAQDFMSVMNTQTQHNQQGIKLQTNYQHTTTVLLTSEEAINTELNTQQQGCTIHSLLLVNKGSQWIQVYIKHCKHHPFTAKPCPDRPDLNETYVFVHAINTSLTTTSKKFANRQ